MAHWQGATSRAVIISGLVVGLFGAGCTNAKLRVSTAPPDTAKDVTTLPSSSLPAPTTLATTSTTVSSPPTTWLGAGSTTTTSSTQPVDPAAAAAAIRKAYASMIDVNASNAQREGAVQGVQGPGANSLLDQTRGITTGASVVVYSVRFTSRVTAAVVFQFFWNGGLSPIFPKPLDGGAVYDGGAWKVDTATACSLAVGAGYSCPADPSARPPTADTVPPGLTVPTAPPPTSTTTPTFTSAPTTTTTTS